MLTWKFLKRSAPLKWTQSFTSQFSKMSYKGYSEVWQRKKCLQKWICKKTHTCLGRFLFLAGQQTSSFREQASSLIRSFLFSSHNCSGVFFVFGPYLALCYKMSFRRVQSDSTYLLIRTGLIRISKINSPRKLQSPKWSSKGAGGRKSALQLPKPRHRFNYATQQRDAAQPEHSCCLDPTIILNSMQTGYSNPDAVIDFRKIRPIA